jgi:hypothetical protein
VLQAARWLPVGAAFVYALVVVRRLPVIVSQLTWNADYVSQMSIAQSIGTMGKSGRAIVIQIGYFWFDLVTFRLPGHTFIWEYAPSAMALVALILMAWTGWRLAGTFAAALTASVGLSASPLVLSTEAAQAYHGSTWFGAAMLAAYLCWVLTTRAGRWVTIATSVVVALAAGLATASDPLLIPVGDAPFAAALIVAWRARPDQVARPQLFAGVGAGVGAAAVTLVLLLANRLAGYGSSFPRGLAQIVPPEQFVGNLRLLVSGIFQVAGMPTTVSALGIVLGLLLVAGVLLPVIWLIGSLRGQMPAPFLAVIAYWSASALLVAAAFLFSDVPANFGDTSSRYLVPIFFAAVATVPLWAAADAKRAAVLAVPAAVWVLANAAAVEHDAGAGVFAPPFSPSLSAPIAFLEQQGLTRGYAVYDEASPISWKTGFALHVYPVTEVFASQGDTCGSSSPGTVCPYAYNSVSDWYAGDHGPTFILVDPGMYRLDHAPSGTLDTPTNVYQVDRFVIYVYSDDVARHMGTPERFTRPLI